MNGREVTEEEGWKFAESHGLLFKETSALAGTGIDNAFELLLEWIDDNR